MDEEWDRLMLEEKFLGETLRFLSMKLGERSRVNGEDVRIFYSRFGLLDFIYILSV
jgi:hypothetical protein